MKMADELGALSVPTSTPLPFQTNYNCLPACLEKLQKLCEVKLGYIVFTLVGVQARP